MQMNEICKRCNVTKKAVEYYIGEGLLSPRVGENGYRRFTESDIKRLREISLLRKLGMSVPDIGVFLLGGDKSGIVEALRANQQKEVKQAGARLDCLEYLLKNGCDLEHCSGYIDGRLEGQLLIIEKLRQAFPGDYGTFLSIHFGRFLNTPADSAEKSEAYRNIIAFLDDTRQPELTDDVKALFNSLFEGSQESMQSADNALLNAVDDYDSFIKDHQTFVKQYLEYRSSEDYRSSPASQLRELMIQFMQSSGYYDVFIPNMMILSDSYKAYHNKLTLLNEKMLDQYPELQALQQS